MLELKIVSVYSKKISSNYDSIVLNLFYLLNSLILTHVLPTSILELSLFGILL